MSPFSRLDRLRRSPVGVRLGAGRSCLWLRPELERWHARKLVGAFPSAAQYLLPNALSAVRAAHPDVELTLLHFEPLSKTTLAMRGPQAPLAANGSAPDRSLGSTGQRSVGMPRSPNGRLGRDDTPALLAKSRSLARTPTRVRFTETARLPPPGRVVGDAPTKATRHHAVLGLPARGPKRSSSRREAGAPFRGKGLVRGRPAA
jgi:hypothetical protein